MNPLQVMLECALACLNVPYRWGGDNPVQGMDCSGFVQWVLKSVGLDPKGDQTAQGLCDHFDRTGSHTAPTLGALVFFGESMTKVTHVALCLNEWQMIEAGGGNSLTKTKSDAEALGACVRVRMITSRSDRVAIIKPSFSRVGLIK